MTSIQCAKELFYNKNFEKAREIFIEENDLYSAGLCSLLLKDVNCAKKYWNQTKNNSPASAWGLSVIDLISLKPQKKPTFFQVRAQLEIYINLFIENNLIDWAQNLVSCADYLYRFNPEAYKFIARVLFSNGYFKLAIHFCKKSLSLVYCDPEAFLILAQCQFLLADLGESLDSVNKILTMVPDYYPAKLFNKVVRSEIEKKYKNKD